MNRILRTVRKELNAYPPREMLVELGKMSKEEREESTLFGVYLWEATGRHELFWQCERQLEIGNGYAVMNELPG